MCNNTVISAVGGQAVWVSHVNRRLSTSKLMKSFSICIHRRPSSAWVQDTLGVLNVSSHKIRIDLGQKKNNK